MGSIGMQWPPTPGPGVERLEPERLGRRAADDVPQVDAELVAEPRHLVDQRDVDVPVGVLQQLGHLGLAGAAGRHHGVDEARRRTPPARCEQLGRDARRRPSGCCACRTSVLPGSIRSGEKARKKSSPAASPPRPEHRPDDLLGRAGVGRGLEHDERARAQVRGDRRGRRRSTAARSGPPSAASGVGTQIAIAAAAPRIGRVRGGLEARGQHPLRRRRRRCRRRASGRRRGPRSPLGSTSRPTDRQAGRRRPPRPAAGRRTPARPRRDRTPRDVPPAAMTLLGRTFPAERARQPSTTRVGRIRAVQDGSGPHLVRRDDVPDRTRARPRSPGHPSPRGSIRVWLTQEWGRRRAWSSSRWARGSSS